MRKQLLLGALLGGIVAFAWSMISWEVIGWHEKQMLTFQNEDLVAAAIATSSTADGIYLYPGNAPAGLSKDQQKAFMAEQYKKMNNGPIIFAAVRRGGFPSFGAALAEQFFGIFVAALLLTWLLNHTVGLSYWRRVIFVAVGGLAAAIIVDVPNWTWWGFSPGYTVVDLIDFTLMWFVAGLVIAKVGYPKPS